MRTTIRVVPERVQLKVNSNGAEVVPLRLVLVRAGDALPENIQRLHGRHAALHVVEHSLEARPVHGRLVRSLDVGVEFLEYEEQMGDREVQMEGEE